VTTPHTRLAAALADRYTIERELGQGGMATVYLAEDLKHHRKVAVKVLRPELAATMGPERFAREIEVAARLQHPHILGLLDSGEVDGFFYYVMPYVDGETLRDRLARSGELPVHEAVRLLGEIADALAAAHKGGVVHRDIKPENILLSGRHAMVMDFGVAKAVTEASGRQQLTTAGVALGTPAYMAPEQATADPHLDGRVDIYALGVTAYEMLTGHPPFHGLNPQQTLAAHVTQAPVAVGQRRPGLSPALESVVMRCLEKRPADRFQTADELVAALEPLATPSGGMTPTHTMPVAAVLAPPGASRWAKWAVGALVVAAAGFGAWHFLGTQPITVALGRSEQLTTEAGLEIQAAISPDGKLVAYSAGNSARMRIFLRPVGGGRTIPLSDDSSAVETQARWSPDGNSLLFLTRRGVSVAPALGGNSRPVVAPGPTGARVMTATWSPDGLEIAFVRGDTLQVQPLSGGTGRPITTAERLHSCSWSPDGRWIACVSGNTSAVIPGSGFGNRAPSDIVIVPATGGDPVPLHAGGVNQSPIWSPDGRHLFFLSDRDGPLDVYAVTLSSSGRPRGETARLTTGLGAISIALSADGQRLAYATYSARANIWALPIPVGAPTSAEAATPITSGSQVIETLRVSRDGRWLVFDSNLRGNSDIYRVPVDGGQPEQLTTDAVDEFAPDLSPDGKAIAYHVYRTAIPDIEAKPLDGGAIELVAGNPERESYPVWSPDGRSIMYLLDGSINIARRSSGGKWALSSLLVGDEAFFAEWSPDGASVAYGGLKGRILLVPLAGGIPRQLHQPGPSVPEAEGVRWSRDGRTIYYKAHDAEGQTSFWSVSAAGGTPRLRVRFSDPDRQSSREDFAVDARRFYFTIEDRQSDVFVAELTSR